MARSVSKRGGAGRVPLAAIGLGPLGAGAARDGGRVFVACHSSTEEY